MANPLSTSQQISEEYGIHPRKKRPRTHNDLFDILDGGNGQGQSPTGDDDEGMYDASLPDDLPAHLANAGLFPPSAALGSSMDFTSNAFLGNDAMDTDPLKMSGTFLASSSTFPAPTATLFDSRVKFDPGITMAMNPSLFTAQATPHGRAIFSTALDPAQQALQLLQASVLETTSNLDPNAMDVSPFSPSQSQLGNSVSQHHNSIVAIMPSESSVPQDRNLLLDPKRVILELRVRHGTFSRRFIPFDSDSVNST